MVQRMWRRCEITDRHHCRIVSGRGGGMLSSLSYRFSLTIMIITPSHITVTFWRKPCKSKSKSSHPPCKGKGGGSSGCLHLRVPVAKPLDQLRLMLPAPAGNCSGQLRLSAPPGASGDATRPARADVAAPAGNGPVAPAVGPHQLRLV